ncbi:MAG: hypothetical protein ACI8ZB_003183 [Desulforhopalus sp.]
MSSALTCNEVEIGWNGVRLRVPENWETIVSGPNHLIFEDDFNPIFQIRWKKIDVLSPQKWQEKCDDWWQQLGVTNGAVKFPPELNKLADKFTLRRYYRGKQPMQSGGICYCDQCHTLFFFQQLGSESSMWKKTAEVLSTLSCHGFTSTLWKIQDFSVKTLAQHTLTDYTFKAGLTRLSFSADTCNLQICRLGQASSRLSSQSLEGILFTLADTRELQVELSKDKNTCSGARSPSVTKQILFRMRKEKPFIDSKIWLVPEHDRLLACIASSKRPISTIDVTSCYETFQIV